AIDDGLLKTAGGLRFDRLTLKAGAAEVKNIRGKLAFQQDAKKIPQGIAGVFSNEDILRQKPRIAYYNALRSYVRDDQGIRVERFPLGRADISNVAFNGRIERGMLLVDHFALNTLSGDVIGQCAIQLSADKALRIAAGAEFSNVDVSLLSKTEPGPDS